MTLLELQDVLGNQITRLTDDTLTSAQKSEILEASQAISSIAKQMINNADVVLRAEKLLNEGKLQNSKIEKMI